jgi:hypothetical protein
MVLGLVVMTSLRVLPSMAGLVVLGYLLSLRGLGKMVLGNGPGLTAVSLMSLAGVTGLPVPKFLLTPQDVTVVALKAKR